MKLNYDSTSSTSDNCNDSNRLVMGTDITKSAH